jgi:peptide-methionine (S)-S-oxide reductase
MEKATFAAGCFWGIEEVFRKTPGVLSTRAGFSGGKVKDPTYKQVCSDITGHAEAVEVEYDPAIVSYQTLLEIFWKVHNPTTRNRQGADIGSQYRSIIFYHSPQQQELALQSKANKQKVLQKEIVTEIIPSAPFYEAESYHQKYYEKHGGHCGI